MANINTVDVTAGVPTSGTGTVFTLNYLSGTANAALPSGAAAMGVSDGTNLQFARGFDADTGAGTEYVLGVVPRVPTSGGSVAQAYGTGVRSASTLRVTIATDDVVPASQSGTWNIGTVTTLTSLTQMNGQAIAMGTGVRSVGTQRVTIATDDVVPASQSGTWNIATVTNLSQLGGTAIAMGTGVRSAGTQRVTIATDDVVPASQSGTWTVQPGNTANTTPWIFQISDGTNAAAIKAASTAPAATDKALVVAMSPNNMPFLDTSNFVSGVISTAMTSTTSTSLVAAPGASLRNYITTIIASNSHATVGTDILIQDGSGGTTLMVIPAAANYGGATITLPTPLKQPTTNTALYAANVTTGSSTKVSAYGYKAA